MRLALLGLLLSATAGAHAFNPSLLELKATGPEEWQLNWRNQTGTLHLPCGNLSQCRLEGKTLSIDGLGDRDVLVRIQFFDGRSASAVLRRDQPSLTVRETPEAPAYIRLGTTHILGGFDHLLFVFGLLLLVERRKLLFTLTAFTLAHSLTLALAMLDVVRVPQAPVEAAIALSILFVAVELVRERRQAPRSSPGEAPVGAGLTARRPWLIAFAFGLLHGLGFAGALGEIGLPAGQVAPALVCFNVGVELGQVAFVAALLLLAELVPLARVPRRVPAYLIGALASFFCLERIGSFWS